MPGSRSNSASNEPSTSSTARWGIPAATCSTSSTTTSSHAVSRWRPPQVLGVWPTVEDIEWDTLPTRFVLKSAGGSTGRGVLPLERLGDRFRVISGSREYTTAEVLDHFRVAKGVRPPYFAEALLPGTGEVLPDDLKVYTFYGEVAYVMVRRKGPDPGSWTR